MSSLYVAPPMKNWRTTLERLEKFLSKDFYTDYNLTSKIYEEIFRFKSAPHLKVENRPLFEDVVEREFEEGCDLSQKFGPTWATHWFKLDFSTAVPDEAKEKMAKFVGKDSTTVGLIWNCDCEALIYSSDGTPLQSFSGERTFFPLPAFGNPFYVEMACNGMFGAGEHCIQPPKLDRTYSISDVKMVVRNNLAFKVFLLLEMIHDLAKDLTDKSIPASRALFTANDVVNQLCMNGMDDSQLEQALNKLQTLFPPGSSPPSSGEWGASAGNEEHLAIDAFGHCHIDTAWLWPYDETKRKCARSWCNQLSLMSKNPNFKFVCSQTQQLQWVEQNYPLLFNHILQFVQMGQFIPVGGTWVEMDGNVPSCESFCRQFLYGQMYFKEKFGNFTDIFWLPDTFGYSTCLPQVANLSGIHYFLTQKLSWNLVNTFPHNSFIWEGIDGSQLLTHFPPNDNYCARLFPNELIFAEKNFKDKGRSSEAMMLFGFGDGGGGPTEEMVTRLETLSAGGHRLAMPSCKTTTPSHFFQRLEKDKGNLCKWVGELYLELHQGTFTTQSEIKRRNSQMEVLLRAAEFYLAVSHLIGGIKHIQDLQRFRCNVRKAWELVLCNQFHDVLPGSCIEEVVDNAMTYYNEAESLIKFPYLEEDASAEIFDVDLASWSFNPISGKKGPVKTTVSKDSDDLFCLTNQFLSAKFDPKGQIVSLRIPDVDKNLCSIEEPTNIFRLYHDMPLFWDAWDIMDYHAETKVDISAKEVEIVNGTTLLFKYSVSSGSSFELSVWLDPGSPFLEFSLKVDWHEAHKLLKVEFPLNIRCTAAVYGSQIGFVERTNTLNTSIDSAKHEVCGHQWAALQQWGVGCAVLTPNKYGFRALHSTLALSLLRSPKSPDANADMGTHRISYALMPYKGTFQEANVSKVANEFLLSLEENKYRVSIPTSVKSSSLQNLFTLSTNAVRIECFKHAENCVAETNERFVLRLAEQFGSSVSCEVKISDQLSLKEYAICDILERPIAGNGKFEDLDGKNGITLRFEPFKLISLLLIK